jgi:hypothetical protein
MIKQDNILIKLTGESNFLFWMDGLSRIGDYLPKGTSQFKLTILVKGSIRNAEDKRKAEGMHTMEAINDYKRQRYMTGVKLIDQIESAHLIMPRHEKRDL